MMREASSCCGSWWSCGVCGVVRAALGYVCLVNMYVHTHRARPTIFRSRLYISSSVVSQIKMNSVVLKLLEDNAEGLALKKLKKRALVAAEELEDFSGKGKSELKDAFETSLTNLLENNRIAEEEGVYTKCEKKSKSSKRSRADLGGDDDEDTAVTIKKETMAAAPVEERKKPKEDAKNFPPNYDEDDEDQPLKIRRGGKSDISNLTNLSCKIDLSRDGERAWRDNLLDDDYLRTNPDGITRIFCGNLNKKVTEEEMHACLEGLVYIKWITDKQTREFYGSTFLEMKDAKSAAIAVLKDKSKFMGRPLKIYYCPPRPGDIWPPKDDGTRGNAGRQGNTTKPTSGKEKSQRPEGCKKLFMGNLSYNIDDEAICDFFKGCGEIVGLRWLTHKGTEEFRGCGFIEFSAPDAAEEAMKLDGKEVLGRPVRLDWTD